MDSLPLGLLDLHVREQPESVDDARLPPQLLRPAEHQERVGVVGVEAHEDVPPRVPLRIDAPAGHPLAEKPVHRPAEASEEERRDEVLCEPLGGSVCGVDVVLVHPRDAEE